MVYFFVIFGLNVGIVGFLEGNLVVIFIIDCDYKVICWNKVCEMLIGILVVVLIGICDYWWVFYLIEWLVMVDLIIDGCMEKDIWYFY